MKINILNSRSQPLRTTHNEAHLWLIKDQLVDDIELLSAYMGSLSPEEKIKQKKFYFAKHRHQYLITRGFLRHILSLYDNTISPSAWHFYTNSYGRPYIANPELSIPLHFNLSHTDNLIALVVSHYDKLGVDVEWTGRNGKTVELADSYFSPLEVAELHKLPSHKQENRFFSLWTLKEAYIKACGKGLSIPLDVFSYCFSQQQINIFFSKGYVDNPNKWLFWQFAPYIDYLLSLAMGEATTSFDDFNLTIYEVGDGQNAERVFPPLVARSPSAATLIP